MEKKKKKILHICYLPFFFCFQKLGLNRIFKPDKGLTSTKCKNLCAKFWGIALFYA